MALNQILKYDPLSPGVDPTYGLPQAQDVWYLGLIGELASEIKCSKITLPMLSKETFNPQEKLADALKEAISIRPKKQVKNIEEAYNDFTKEMGMFDIERFSIIGSKDYLQAKQHAHFALDLPAKTVVLVPDPEDFGIFASNEEFFNFYFMPRRIFVYGLRSLKDSVVDTDPSVARMPAPRA